MNGMKKILAFVLVLALTLGLAAVSFAADSPSVGPEYDPTTGVVTEKIPGAVVKAQVEEKKLLSVQSDEGKKAATISALIDQYGKTVLITTIGDGKKGVLASTDGRKITTLTTSADLESITFAKAALKGSKVKKLVIKGKKVTFAASAFKGTKEKSLKIYLKGVKKASQVKIAKGALAGLGAKAKIIVSAKQMSEKQYRKLVDKIFKAGFKGSVVRK